MELYIMKNIFRDNITGAKLSHSEESDFVCYKDNLYFFCIYNSNNFQDASQIKISHLHPNFYELLWNILTVTTSAICQMPKVKSHKQQWDNA